MSEVYCPDCKTKMEKINPDKDEEGSNYKCPCGQKFLIIWNNWEE